MGQLPSTDCERMRGHVSASLDGELSQVEHARFEAHLAACTECRAYAADVGRTSQLLREAPLEELAFPIAVPGRRLAVARRLQVVAAAAGVAAVVGLSATLGSSGERIRPSAAPPQASAEPASLRFPEQELKMLYRVSLRNQQLNVHSRMTL